MPHVTLTNTDAEKWVKFAREVVETCRVLEDVLSLASHNKVSIDTLVALRRYAEEIQNPPNLGLQYTIQLRCSWGHEWTQELPQSFDWTQKFYCPTCKGEIL